MGRKKLSEDRPCKKCGKSRPEVEFHKYGLYRHSWCISCTKERSLRWYQEHPELSKERSKKWESEHREYRMSQKLTRQYGITLDDKKNLQVSQKNTCPICKRPFPNLSAAHVDHCHKTGRVRGLLCHGCNAGIGLLGDDPVRLLAALIYLCPGVAFVLAWVLKNFSPLLDRAA